MHIHGSLTIGVRCPAKVGEAGAASHRLPRMEHRAWSCRVGLVLALAILAGCRSGTSVAERDPLTAARESRLSVAQRTDAVKRAWAEATAGKTNRAAVRTDLKDLAWSVDLPAPVRIEALSAIFSDESSAADNQNLARLMLPREPEPTVTARLAQEAGSRGWVETTPALVRSLSRERAKSPDAQRPEYLALRTLHPQEDVASVVKQVLLAPPKDDAGSTLASPDRIRADAWDLLKRLDPDGSVRAGILVDVERTTSSDAGLEALRAGLKDLRVAPLSGDEYLWLLELRRGRDKARSGWWSETSGVVAQLPTERVGRLQIRHLEPIRWSAKARPERLAMSRDELLSEVRSRLSKRDVIFRSRRERDAAPPAPERLSAWENRLSWGDLIAVLAVDDAVRSPGVVRSLLTQRDMDRADERAEYGGLLRVDGAGAEGFAAVLYPPREGERRGDNEFVASPDMMEQGDHALAHYHFHAQQVRYSEYAGPSPVDLGYAGRYGRTCVVFTSIGSTTLNVDYYQPDGIVLDLGIIDSGR